MDTSANSQGGMNKKHFLEKLITWRAEGIRGCPVEVNGAAFAKVWQEEEVQYICLT